MASEMNNPLCSLVEYETGIATRTMEDELTVGGLYIVMFALRNQDKAARYAAQITSLNLEDDDHRHVGFIALDDDLQESSIELYSDIHAGHLKIEFPIQVLLSYQTEEGYFTGYTNDLDMQLEAWDLLSKKQTV